MNIATPPANMWVLWEAEKSVDGVEMLFLEPAGALISEPGFLHVSVIPVSRLRTNTGPSIAPVIHEVFVGDRHVFENLLTNQRFDPDLDDCCGSSWFQKGGHMGISTYTRKHDKQCGRVRSGKA